MSIFLTLVRHGNTFESGETARFVGKTDLPLTDFGKEQAKKVAAYVQSQKIKTDIIYSGELLRQMETASIICKELGFSEETLKVNSALREIDYGKWENLSSAEIKERWPDEFAAWEEKSLWPDSIFSISKSDFENSVKTFFRDISNGNAENILLVTSNGVLRKVFDLINVKPGGVRAKVGTGCVCRIEIEKNKESPLGAAKIIFWDLKPTN